MKTLKANIPSVKTFTVNENGEIFNYIGKIKRQFQFIILKGEQSELVRLFMKTCGIMTQ